MHYVRCGYTRPFPQSSPWEVAWVRFTFGCYHFLFCGYTMTKLSKKKKNLGHNVLVNTEKTNWHWPNCKTFLIIFALWLKIPTSINTSHSLVVFGTNDILRTEFFTTVVKETSECSKVLLTFLIVRTFSVALEILLYWWILTSPVESGIWCRHEWSI